MSNNPSHNLTLIHHAANRSHVHPPSSLSAIKHCLEANAWKIEIDILPIADGNFVLLHDPDLNEITTGTGNAVQLKRADLEQLCYKHKGVLSNEKLAFLDQVVPWVLASPSLGKLQLDLKPFAAMSPALIENLLQVIDPIFHRVQISSIADWSVRAIRHQSPEVDLGFDPLLYLDADDHQPRPSHVPPFRVGAYGLRDDHPLSAYVWGTHQAYFQARAEALLAQAVPSCEWFIRAETLLAAHAAGFDWIKYLHDQGSKVDAWTLDPSGESANMAHELADLGVDEITTNDPIGMAKLLNRPVRF